ncbi:MAG: tRNA (adenosine(37)-N6)-dimethylallyltransferase MiaA, partial [Thermodesulfobacteriota bacterium]|nr:tRNA (adenosine(37)-N6)-dimethylallyltransferase MiaA [Thermodesulfobacteriota bacterium]
MPKVPLLCIPGPTGAGKTSAALFLARELHGGIINFDSRQVYADFPLITAQPTPAEQALSPHFLYGFLSTDQAISAGAYADMAGEAVSEARARGLLPILTGGTGLYLRALLEPLAPIPQVPLDIRAKIQEECGQIGLSALYLRLKELDPASAQRIHPNDSQRITRALEVYEATKRPLSSWHEETGPDGSGDAESLGFKVLKLGVTLDLDVLTQRLVKRIEAMIFAGAVDEARRAMQKCPDKDAPGWSGIGCAEHEGGDSHRPHRGGNPPHSARGTGEMPAGGS